MNHFESVRGAIHLHGDTFQQLIAQRVVDVELDLEKNEDDEKGEGSSVH